MTDASRDHALGRGHPGEEVRPPPPKLPPQRDGVLYAMGVVLLPLGLIPVGSGGLMIVGYGLAGSNDLGMLMFTLATCALLSVAAFAGGVGLIRRSYLNRPAHHRRAQPQRR